MTASEAGKAGKRTPKTGSSKAKPKAKKEIATEDKLKKLFNSLCSQIDGGHFVNGIRTCDKILALSPGDEDATKTKIWLLLQTERYEQALELLGNLSVLNMPFEQAYTLYRLNRLGEARTVLANAEKADDNGVKHLEAQMNYREGLYDATVDIYEKLLDSLGDPDEISDVQTNIQAASLHLDFINSGYLRALDKLPSSVSSSIESAPPPTLPTALGAIAPVTQAAQVATDAKKEEKAPKKPRARRLPKNLPPNAPPPDPERWLKKSERTMSMVGKKRKGGGATQGAAVEPTAVSTGGGSGASGKKGKKKK